MHVVSQIGNQATQGDLYPVSHQDAAFCSPLVQKAKAIVEHYYSAGLGNSHADFSLYQLSDRLFEILNKKNPLLKTFHRIFSGKSQSTQAVKQANKALVAQIVQRAVMRLLGRGETPSLKQLKAMAYQVAAEMPTDLYVTEFTIQDQQQIKNYINKSAPKVMKWLKSNAGIKASQERLDPEGQAFRDQLGLELNWNSNALDFILDDEHQTLSFVTKDGGKIMIDALYLKNKGPDWVKNVLPGLAKNLENQVEYEVQKIFQKSSGDWEDFVGKSNSLKKLMNTFSKSNRSELALQLPSFLEQLIKNKLEDPKNYFVFYTPKDGQTIKLSGPDFKERGKEWRTHGFPLEAKKLEDEVHDWVSKLVHEPFLGAEKPIPANDVKKSLHAYFMRTNNLAKIHPHLLSVILDGALKNKYSFDVPRNFKGAYLKKGNAESNFLKTRVKAASGKVYELLNTLSEDDSMVLKDQHNMDRKEKTILGKGGFGKVRVARDIETGELVAVKKFSVRQLSNARSSSPEEDANREVTQFLKVQKRLSTINKNETLATMRDYAHVQQKLPQQKSKKSFSNAFRQVLNQVKSAPVHQGRQPEKFVGKSYIFMDLANQGDGMTMLGTLRGLRAQGRLPEAQQRFIQLATQYSKSIMDMHELNLTHRDIKPGNFLHVKDPITGTQQVKLADFGFVKDQRRDGEFDGYTLTFLSPEGAQILALREQLNFVSKDGARGPDVEACREALEKASRLYNAQAHDAFSLGMTLLKLLNSVRPIQNQLELKFADGNQQTEPLQFDGLGGCLGSNVGSSGIPLIPNHIDNVIASLLDKSPDSRMNVKDAYEQLRQIQSDLLNRNP